MYEILDDKKKLVWDYVNSFAKNKLKECVQANGVPTYDNGSIVSVPSSIVGQVEKAIAGNDPLKIRFEDDEHRVLLELSNFASNIKFGLIVFDKKKGGWVEADVVNIKWDGVTEDNKQKIEGLVQKFVMAVVIKESISSAG